MKRRGSLAISAWFWLASGGAACGGLNSGDIVIVDGDGGSNSGKGGTSGSAGAAMSGGTSDLGGAAAGGEGGEPPIVISDDPPMVVSITPDDGEDDVEPTERVIIEFSESLDEDSLAGAIVVMDGDKNVGAALSFAGTKATLTFPRRLDLLTTYTVSVSTKVKDLAGIALESPFSSSFTVREGKWGHFITLNNLTDTSGPLSGEAFPTPAFDREGNALAVWSQAETANGSYAVWGRFFDVDDGWQPAVKLSSAGTNCDLPSVAMNPQGDALVAWRQRDGSFSRVFARRYTSGDWEPAPQRVNTASASDIPRVATALTEAGDAHVMWSYQANKYYIAGNTAKGSGEWALEETYINGSFDSISGPSIAFNEDGAGFAIWAGITGPMMSTVRVARYVPASGWSNAETLPNSSGALVPYESTPGIVADPSGGAMVSWIRSGDVVTSRFTKANGWSDVAVADGAAAGYLQSWTPHLAEHGGDFFMHWHQNVGSLINAFANKFTDGAWGTEPALLSDGDTSVFGWSDTGFGLDRHGNGIATWVQGADVRFARLVAADGEWAPDALVASLELKPPAEPTEQRSGVAANGMALAVYSEGYPYYERHDTLFAAVFE